MFGLSLTEGRLRGALMGELRGELRGDPAVDKWVRGATAAIAALVDAASNGGG